APRQRTRKRVEDKSRNVHACDARRKSDERANRRQQTSDKNYRLSIFREQAISDIEIVTRNKNVLPILLDEWTSAIHSHPVSHHRPHNAADSSSQTNQPEIHLTGGHEIASERHDDLRREWDACRLDRHQ